MKILAKLLVTRDDVAAVAGADYTLTIGTPPRERRKTMENKLATAILASQMEQDLVNRDASVLMIAEADDSVTLMVHDQMGFCHTVTITRHLEGEVV